MNHPLLHVANILYIISYSVRDILWLRLITILALLCLSYCYVHSSMYPPLYWQMAFIAINVVQVIRLIYERRPVHLTAVERRMHESALKSLTPRQVRRLMTSATWLEAVPGDTIIPEGVDNTRLLLITDGAARVAVKGKQVATITGGQFMGEMSFLTGRRTSASVTAREPVKYLAWSDEALREIGDKDIGLGTALQSALGADLVWKLLDQRSRRVRGRALDSLGTVTLPAQ